MLKKFEIEMQWRICAGIISFLLLVVGCAGEQVEPVTEPASVDASYTIGLLLPNDADFFNTIQEGAEEAASRLGAILVTLKAQDDMATQQAQVQQMIDEQVDLIVITPVDGTALADVVEAADTAGIGVITVDRSVETDVVITHIASDNLAGGRMAGEYLAELVGESGNVVELTGIAGTSAAQARGNGFNEAIAGYGDINVVARETGNFNMAEGEAAMSQILANESDIAAVFAHNDDMILGAIEAAVEAGRADDIIFIGFDAVDAAIDALEDGTLAATIAQQPAEMGRLGVETAVKYLDGDASISDYYPVELALITR